MNTGVRDDVGGGFGIFRSLFGPGLPFLDFLTLGPEASGAFARMSDILRDASSPHLHIRMLLAEGPGWRTQLVAAAATLLLPSDPLTVSSLWQAFEGGGRVAPQLAAALYFRDPAFLPAAFDRLLCTTPVSNPTSAAILRALVGRHPQRERDLLERLDRAVLLDLVARDTNNGDAQVRRWVDLVRPIIRRRTAGLSPA